MGRDQSAPEYPSSGTSHRPARRTLVASGPNFVRKRPIACAPPIGTITTRCASRSRPRPTAAVFQCDLVADALDEHHGHGVVDLRQARAVARIEAAGPLT